MPATRGHLRDSHVSFVRACACGVEQLSLYIALTNGVGVRELEYVGNLGTASLVR